eukprot:ctg_5066.g533
MWCWWACAITRTTQRRAARQHRTERGHGRRRRCRCGVRYRDRRGRRRPRKAAEPKRHARVGHRRHMRAAGENGAHNADRLERQNCGCQRGWLRWPAAEHGRTESATDAVTMTHDVVRRGCLG